MATVLRENIGLLNDKITVTLAKDDYMPAVEQSIKKYAKTANIPGFRKGMVPAGMIRKMHGPSVFADEVLRTVEKELNGYMQKEQLDIFAQPLPLDSDARQLDILNPADYNFSFEIGLKPPINLDLNNIKVTRHRVAIDDALVEEEIVRLRTRHGKMTEPEAVSNDENVLNLQLDETDANGDKIEDGISKANSLLVRYFSESFRPQLIGMRKDDTFDLRLSTALDEKEREWVIGDLGLSKDDPSVIEKHFSATITKIGFVEKSELNEEFFNIVYPGKSLIIEDDFKNAVKNELQQQWDLQTRNQLHDQVYHQLIDHTHLEFPEAFLKRWLQNGGEKPKTAEEAETEYPAFVNSLKWTLISTQLMSQYDIKVEHDEIKEFAKQQIISYMGGQNVENAPWLESYAESMLKDQKFIENTYYQLQVNKLFNLVEQKVNVQENTVTPEQLNAMQHHHSH